jgi:hypothetical protein
MPPATSQANRHSFASAGSPRPGGFRPAGAASRAPSRRQNDALLLKQPASAPPAQLLPLRYTIYVRSFETSARFARPFTSKGDGRAFSTRLDRATTARIHLKIGVELNLQRGMVYFRTTSWSSPTHQYNYPIYPFRFEQAATASPVHKTGIRATANGNSFWFDVQAAEPIMARIPVVGGLTPAISLHGSFTITYANDTLFVFGRILGDGFPDAECFIVDERGKAVLLGTYKHPATGSPLWDLPGQGGLQMMEVSAAIELNCDHQFLWGRLLGHHYNAQGQRDIFLTPTR